MLRSFKIIAIFGYLLQVMIGCQSPEGATEPAKQYHNLKPPTDQEYLVRIFEGRDDSPGTPCGYVNSQGHTVIPIGKYSQCWTDTIRTFGIVSDGELTHPEFIAIDRDDQLLYEVVLYDNGPDLVQEGLFRIKRNGKIGYADQDGYIKIQPQFECASPFENGRARVAFSCELIPDGEHTIMESEQWMYIGLDGKEIKE